MESIDNSGYQPDKQPASAETDASLETPIETSANQFPDATRPSDFGDQHRTLGREGEGTVRIVRAEALSPVRYPAPDQTD